MRAVRCRQEITAVPIAATAAVPERNDHRCAKMVRVFAFLLLTLFCLMLALRLMGMQRLIDMTEPNNSNKTEIYLKLSLAVNLEDPLQAKYPMERIAPNSWKKHLSLHNPRRKQKHEPRNDAIDGGGGNELRRIVKSKQPERIPIRSKHQTFDWLRRHNTLKNRDMSPSDRTEYIQVQEINPYVGHIESSESIRRNDNNILKLLERFIDTDFDELTSETINFKDNIPHNVRELAQSTYQDGFGVRQNNKFNGNSENVKLKKLPNIVATIPSRTDKKENTSPLAGRDFLSLLEDAKSMLRNSIEKTYLFSKLTEAPHLEYTQNRAKQNHQLASPRNGSSRPTISPYDNSNSAVSQKNGRARPSIAKKFERNTAPVQPWTSWSVRDKLSKLVKAPLDSKANHPKAEEKHRKVAKSEGDYMNIDYNEPILRFTRLRLDEEPNKETERGKLSTARRLSQDNKYGEWLSNQVSWNERFDNLLSILNRSIVTRFRRAISIPGDYKENTDVSDESDSGDSASGIREVEKKTEYHNNMANNKAHEYVKQESSASIDDRKNNYKQDEETNLKKHLEDKRLLDKTNDVGKSQYTHRVLRDQSGMRKPYKRNVDDDFDDDYDDDDYDSKEDVDRINYNNAHVKNQHARDRFEESHVGNEKSRRFYVNVENGDSNEERHIRTAHNTDQNERKTLTHHRLSRQRRSKGSGLNEAKKRIRKSVKEAHVSDTVAGKQENLTGISRDLSSLTVSRVQHKAIQPGSADMASVTSEDKTHTTVQHSENSAVGKRKYKRSIRNFDDYNDDLANEDEDDDDAVEEEEDDDDDDDRVQFGTDLDKHNVEDENAVETAYKKRKRSKNRRFYVKVNDDDGDGRGRRYNIERIDEYDRPYVFDFGEQYNKNRRRRTINNQFDRGRRNNHNAETVVYGESMVESDHDENTAVEDSGHNAGTIWDFDTEEVTNDKTKRFLAEVGLSLRLGEYKTFSNTTRKPKKSKKDKKAESHAPIISKLKSVGNPVTGSPLHGTAPSSSDGTVNYSDAIADLMNAVGTSDNINSAISEMANSDAINNAISEVANSDAINNAINTVANSDAVNAINNVINTVTNSDAVNKVTDAVADAYDSVSDTIATAADTNSEAIINAVNALANSEAISKAVKTVQNIDPTQNFDHQVAAVQGAAQDLYDQVSNSFPATPVYELAAPPPHILTLRRRLKRSELANTEGQNEDEGLEADVVDNFADDDENDKIKFGTKFYKHSDVKEEKEKENDDDDEKEEDENEEEDEEKEDEEEEEKEEKRRKRRRNRRFYVKVDDDDEEGGGQRGRRSNTEKMNGHRRPYVVGFGEQYNRNRLRRTIHDKMRSERDSLYKGDWNRKSNSNFDDDQTAGSDAHDRSSLVVWDADAEDVSKAKKKRFLTELDLDFRFADKKHMESMNITMPSERDHRKKKIEITKV